MSEAFVSAIGVALTVCVCSVILKQLGFSGTPAVICIGIVGMLSLVSSGLYAYSQAFGTVAEAVGAEYAKAAVKIIGVGYLSGICADICESLGEASVARAAVMAGRPEILLIALPYFFEILNLGLELVG